jgi:ligand-binding sensor domain-containing protein
MFCVLLERKLMLCKSDKKSTKNYQGELWVGGRGEIMFHVLQERQLLMCKSEQNQN